MAVANEFVYQQQQNYNSLTTSNSMHYVSIQKKKKEGKQKNKNEHNKIITIVTIYTYYKSPPAGLLYTIHLSHIMRCKKMVNIF